ncbi:Hydroxydechloroatrazine ethylaminohydrolase [bioreactor metagenome]|uniref:Hydroxydechloroatrazine ethylaminohydrolase n=1 Tax=bioreactor metagenome TaxID=1076179 RepID=A0A645GS61_9ZZZZ
MLGRDDIGALAVGMAADLFMVDTEVLDLVGTQFDPGCLFGTVGYNRPAKSVVVAGREVARDGVLLHIDEETVRHSANALMVQMLKAGGGIA